MKPFLLLAGALFIASPQAAPRHEAPAGSELFGTYVGRSPCREIAGSIGVQVRDDCAKLKWELTLFADSKTGDPTSYRIDGTLYRQAARTGKWRVTRGIAANPAAVVYELEGSAGHGTIRLYRPDRNVLFFVGDDGRLMVGNASFSYTLNRAQD